MANLISDGSTYSAKVSSDLRTFDEVVMDIAHCGTDRDICCLADDDILAKVIRWVRVFGEERTRKLIRLACICKMKDVPPAKKTITGTPAVYKVPEEPEPPPEEEPPVIIEEPEEPPPPVEETVVCTLPPQHQFSNTVEV